MDFDDDRLYYSHQALQQDGNSGQNNLNNAAAVDDNDNVNLTAVRRHFREFLRKFWLVLE